MVLSIKTKCPLVASFAGDQLGISHRLFGRSSITRALMLRQRSPSDRDTKLCPQCRQMLVFTSRYPVLSIGMALTRARSDVGDGVRYETGVGLPQRRV
jgi:hypothetical protein